MTPNLAYVHLAYGLGADGYRERYRAGQVPDETPYGFHHAEELGWQVLFSNDHPESALVRVVRKMLIRALGFDLVHAFRNRERIRSADVVWTMEEIEYLAVCALPSVLRMPRPRLIAQTIWLFNRWAAYTAAKRWMLQRLIARADLLTFHSKEYLEVVPRLVPGFKPHLLPFGISLQSFPWCVAQETQAGSRPLRVLSMGNDPTRDWPTMLAAFGNDDRFEVRIVSGQVSDAEVAVHANVVCPRNPTMEEFRELYRWADLVVVPMVRNLYSGITVALEATSMGVAVLSSRTGGIPTYFEEGEVRFVEPQDPQALCAAALALSAEQRCAQALRAQAKFQAVDYSTRGMAQRYVALSSALLERRTGTA